MSTPDSAVRVYLIGPEWGLPSMSPFGVKLATWMRVAGIPHRIVSEPDPRKGPKGKSPWIEDGDLRLGDSAFIIAALSERYGIDLEGHLTPRERAEAHTLRRTFEEHFHQVFEYDLFIDEGGWPHAAKHLDEVLPWVLAPLVRPIVRSDSKKGLMARGIARHEAAERALMARQDLDAASAILDDKPYFFGDRPTHVDCTMYGFLAICRATPWPTASQAHLRTLDNLNAFLDRMHAAYWASEPVARVA